MAVASFNMLKKLRQIRDTIYFVLDLLTGYRPAKYITVMIYRKTRLVNGRLTNGEFQWYMSIGDHGVDQSCSMMMQPDFVSLMTILKNRLLTITSIKMREIFVNSCVITELLRKTNDFLILIKFLYKRRRYKPILILCFHQISSEIDPEIDMKSIWTSLANFVKTIEFLHKHGYYFVKLKDAVNYLESGKIRDRHYASITFDDGYASILNILPYLIVNNIPTTFFINTAYLDEEKYNWIDIVNFAQNVADENQINEEFKEAAKKLIETQNSDEFIKCKEIVESFAVKIRNWQVRYLTTEQLFAINNPLFSFGLHGHEHFKYDIMPDHICKKNLELNIAALKPHPNYVPYFALPFGRWQPRNLELIKSLNLKPFFCGGNLNYSNNKGYNRIDVSDIVLNLRFLALRSGETTIFNRLYKKYKNLKIRRD